MKYIKFRVLCAAGLLTLMACNDSYLDRLPTTELVPEKFFKSEADLQMYSNSFYQMLPGGEKLGYTNDYPSDDFEGGDAEMTAEEKGTIQPSSGLGTDQWTWQSLRNVNYFIEATAKSEIDEGVKNSYLAVARFFRAWFYFDKVKRFGDVPFYGHVLREDSEELLKPRDPRGTVMDSILADLDYAIEHAPKSSISSRVNRFTALALKSRICLFEGTWRKYHTYASLPDADKFLELAAAAAKEVIDGGSYSLYATGNPTNDYASLFQSEKAISQEVILTREYAQGLAYHSTNYVFIGYNQGKWSATKSLINTYLKADGTPFTAQSDYEKASFYDETQERDPRLAQTVRTPGYHRLSSTLKVVQDFQQAVTGYQFTKYVTTSDKDQYMQCTNDYPIIRLAEVMLNYAEARAERGLLTQADLDISINRIRDRAGMPHLNLGQANGNVDPWLAKQYQQVKGSAFKGAILEIRRERRVELAMEGFRYDDIRRWYEGHLVRETYQGIYVPYLEKTIDLDHDGKMDVIFTTKTPATKDPALQYVEVNSGGAVLSAGESGNLILHPSARNKFEDYQYLYPIPLGEFTLNKNLIQNPGYPKN